MMWPGIFPPQCGAPSPQAAATTPSQAPLPQQATDQLQQGIHYLYKLAL